MTKLMTEARFQALIDAYGALPARWPDAERQPALDFLTANASAQTLLAEACAVDDLLDAVKVTDHARAELDQTVFEAAIDRFSAEFMPAGNVVRFPPSVSAKSPRRHVPWSMVWGAGIGLAACLAGATLGVNLSMASLSDVRAQTVLEQVAMIDSGD